MLLRDYVKQNEKIIFYSLMTSTYLAAIYSIYMEIAGKINFAGESKFIISSVFILIPFLTKFAVKTAKWIFLNQTNEGVNRLLFILSLLIPLLYAIDEGDIEDSLFVFLACHIFFWLTCAPLFWIYIGFVADKK